MSRGKVDVRSFVRAYMRAGGRAGNGLQLMRIMNLIFIAF